MMINFIAKSSSVTKLISGSMGLSINKICGIGRVKIHVHNEKPLHPQKITVWYGLHAGGVVGPYFFVDDSGRHVTVNGNTINLWLNYNTSLSPKNIIF